MSQFFIVDVFAEDAYAGNQLAVVLDAGSLESGQMQAIAREFDFSETTFVIGRHDDAHRVRIFTPAEELPFAGHPTIGTAAVLRQLHGGEAVSLELGIGRVEICFEGGPENAIAWLTAPPPVLGTVRARAEAARLLRLEPGEIAADFAVQEVSVGIGFLMVPLLALSSLQRVQLDVEARERATRSGLSVTGIYAFCRETHESGRAVASRMLFDANGPREDPATGSACVCLGGYALAHAYLGEPPFDVAVEQGYEIGRPSLLRLRGRLEEGVPRVSVGGRTVFVAEGRLL